MAQLNDTELFRLLNPSCSSFKHQYMSPCRLSSASLVQRECEAIILSMTGSSVGWICNARILQSYLSFGLAVFVLIGAKAFLLAMALLVLGIVCLFKPPCSKSCESLEIRAYIASDMSGPFFFHFTTILRFSP